MTKLSVIVPTKDRRQVLEKSLDALSNSLIGLDAEVIVVNDGEESLDALTAKYPGFAFRKNPGRGVASARNFGVSLSTGSLLLFLDDDILVNERSIRQVISLHQQHRNACFNVNWEYTKELDLKLQETVFGRFLKRNRMTSFRGWYNDESTWRENALFESKSVASFHLSIERNLFLESGGYNEGFPFAGFEDYDFPVRLRAIGISFFIDTRVTVYHNELDRMNLTNWLNSQERRAVTRRFAVDQGYTELTLSFNWFKQICFFVLWKTERLTLSMLRMMDKIRFLDKIGYKMIALTQATRIFRGYSNRMT
ncbi:MAG TPA: glycosyltransferase [Ohtaekwangia sp.]|nr:glycosyltransferase [Ohtaekwangia sp.]